MAKELKESKYPSYKKMLVKSPSRTHALSQTYVNPDEFPIRVYTVNHAKKIEYVYGVFNADSYCKVVKTKIDNGKERDIDQVYDSTGIDHYAKPKFSTTSK
jgi:hypothetical protein